VRSTGPSLGHVHASAGPAAPSATATTSTSTSLCTILCTLLIASLLLVAISPRRTLLDRLTPLAAPIRAAHHARPIGLVLDFDNNMSKVARRSDVVNRGYSEAP
jgi:hypothetical protein